MLFWWATNQPCHLYLCRLRESDAGKVELIWLRTQQKQIELDMTAERVADLAAQLRVDATTVLTQLPLDKQHLLQVGGRAGMAGGLATAPPQAVSVADLPLP